MTTLISPSVTKI